MGGDDLMKELTSLLCAVDRGSVGVRGGDPWERGFGRLGDPMRRDGCVSSAELGGVDGGRT